MPPKKTKKQQKQKKIEQRRRRNASKRQFQKRKAQNTYGDAGWQQEFKRFSDQLRVWGLRIKDVAGDGNCLFR